MQSFASVLESFLRLPVAVPPKHAPLEDTLRSFEAAFDGCRLSETVLRRTGTTPSWASELGLELPCTTTDIKRAFRRMAFATHPDRLGGSHEAFLRTQALLQEALQAMESGLPSEPVTRETRIPVRHFAFQSSSPLCGRAISAYA